MHGQLVGILPVDFEFEERFRLTQQLFREKWQNDDGVFAHPRDIQRLRVGSYNFV